MFFRSLKKEILTFTLGLTILTIIATTVIGVFSTQSAGDDATGKTGSVLQDQAKEFLMQITKVAAEQQDLLFERIKNDTNNVALHISNIYDNRDFFSGGYWIFEDRIFRKDGKYLNQASDISTVHVPSFVKLDSVEKRDIELSAYLDFFVPGILNNNPDVAAVYTIDTKGVTRYFPNIVIGELAPADYDPREDIYYKPATPEFNAEKKIIWSDLYEDVAGRGLMITATAPVYTRRGFDGIASIDMFLTNIIENITAYSPVEDSYAFLLDKSGTTVAFPDKAYKDILGRDLKEGETRTDLANSSDDFLPILNEMIHGKVGFGSIKSKDNGRELLLAYAPLDQTGFSMAIVVDRATMLKAIGTLRTEISQSIKNTVALGILPASLFIIFVASIVGVFLVGKIVGPIRQLTLGAHEIGKGNLDYSLDIQSKNEIGDLASSFNKMSRTLKKSRKELEQYSMGLETKVKERTQELEHANEKLRTLDKQKTEFVSIASHQLRSPLTAIKGYSSMLLEGSYGKLSAKPQEAVDRIFQSSQKLVIVIEDFLNISRIELGTMKYAVDAVDIKKMVEGIVTEMRPSIEKNGLKLTCDCDQKGDYTVQADAGKISQVVTNMIDNSVKYTPKGEIHVKVSRPSDAAVRVEVKDTGVGITAETMPKLFQKFSRASDASRVNIKGTGLGLYVAKQIVDAHGGKIWAESEGEGKGSTFTVEFKTGPISIGSVKTENK